MRKSLFLTIVLSLCVADFSVFAAVRGGRGMAPKNNTPGDVYKKDSKDNNAVPGSSSARAGKKQTVVNGNVSARAGKKQTVVNNGAKPSSGSPMAARAGATQKVINTGTKVATAAENTAVPQECQDAFYGCMDAFCMLDNASGGRCQCNDKITELDAVLEDILRLDQQSYIMATEGVERIQMGEAEEEIMKRAKAAGDKAANANKEAEANKKKARTLDLSIFDNNVFSDLDDDIFDAQSAQNSLLDKKGTALFNETVKMCGAQIPAQCKSYGQMLSLVYAQKIKSDCIAYENSLKAQKNQSQQKLQTAQKALRDAALDEYKNQNKYSTTGECAVAFTQCMKTTAECGDDYTGCVTLAARENLTNTKPGSKKAKQTKIKGQVSGADITLAASTMESLLAKKEICAHITKQCVNSNRNDAVWNVFLRNAAPALKSAELIAEQNLRDNCIPSVAECFTKACKSQFGNNDESYDMCLSDPSTYKALCKVQLEPCLEATGGSYDKAEQSSLWNGLLATLAAMKVDACTKEVKDCLLSEDRCGADYAGCIGLDTATIGDLCPDDKLTACMDKYDPNTVKQYVAQVAQGLAVQIDNSLATVCQNAADEAMIKACGDTESCESANFDLSTLESGMKVMACTGGSEKGTCHESLAMFDAGAKIEDKGNFYRTNKIKAVLTNAPEISYITFKDNKFGKDSGNDATDNVISILDAALNRIIAQINADPKVVYCREGREVQGFSAADKKKFGKNESQGPRFPNLTDSYMGTIADSLLGKLSVKNAELSSKFTQKMAELNNQITEAIYAGDEQKIDAENKIDCEQTLSQSKEYEEEIKPEDRDGWCRDTLSYNKTLTYWIGKYNPETNVCEMEQKKWECEDWICGVFCTCACREFDTGTVVNTKSVQMAKSH